MPDIRFVKVWDKTDKLPSGDTVPNHESSLSEAEMKDLVLLTLTIPGMDAPPAEMDAEIKKLAVRLAAADGKVVVKKGIHQRTDDAHFTINLDPETGGAYHVWLKAGDDVAVSSKPLASGPNAGKVGKTSLFRYQPTGISHYQGAVEAKWPAAFVISKGKMGIGRLRGTSFSIGNSALVASKPPSCAALGNLVNP